MNVVKTSRVRNSLSSQQQLQKENAFVKINLYQEIPNMEVSLDDFEEYAVDRLTVLKGMETLKMKVGPTSKTAESNKRRLLSKISDYHKDWISHYVLRLAYCRTEDLRRWFLAQEVALLKWRLEEASKSSTNNKALKAVLPEEAQLVQGKELESLKPLLLAATPDLLKLTKQRSDMKIYRVPFTNALDLVQHRQVFVKRGMAYVPESKLVNLITAKFRAKLSRELLYLASVPMTPAAQRTHAFLKNLATSDVVNDEFASQNKNEAMADLTPNNVNAHVKHMPLCMAQLNLALTKEHHLKHWGRLQYGLFLKGCGLSLEDALVYFERQFAKDFQKEYSYNVRHMYGKEGKRANYPPYSCAKVIHSNAPNANEHHGCPYKHGTVQEVTGLLSRLGVAPKDQKSIVIHQQSHNYQLACVEHFKAAHPNALAANVDNLGNHPNAWFQASVAHDKATTTASPMVIDEAKPKVAVSVSP